MQKIYSIKIHIILTILFNHKKINLSQMIILYQKSKVINKKSKKEHKS